MVLEGKEEGCDHDSDDTIGNEKNMRLSKREIWSSDAGVTDNEEEKEERKERNSAMMITHSDQSASKGEQWEWPEDVF